MDHTGIVIHHSKRFETILRSHFGGEKFGLGDLVIAAHQRLPIALREKLKHFTFIRNQFAHDLETNRIRDVKGFVVLVNFIELELARVFPHYVPLIIYEADFLPPTPFERIVVKEKVVYVREPNTRELLQIYSIPISLLK